MPTIWLVFAYYLCVWLAVKTQHSSWWKPWLGLGLFAGVDRYARRDDSLRRPAPARARSFCQRRARTAVAARGCPKIAARRSLVLVGGLYVGASPAWIHNYFIAREPVMLSAHSGINFWIGNNPTATGYPKMPPGIRATQEGLLKDSITLAEEAVGQKMTRAEVSKYWSATGQHLHPRQSPRMAETHGGQIREFLERLPVRRPQHHQAVCATTASFRPDCSFGFIAALGLAGLLPAIWRFPRAALGRGGGAAAHVRAAAGLRHRALPPRRRARLDDPRRALGLWMFWENRRARPLARRRQPIWRSAAGSRLVRLHPAHRSSACGRSIITTPASAPLASGDLDRAQRNLETAYAYVPNNADINFALGNLWLERSNRQAPRAGRKPRRTHPRQATSTAVPSTSSRATPARSTISASSPWRKSAGISRRNSSSRSIEAEPDDAKTHYLLARVRSESGNPDRARKPRCEKALRTARPNAKGVPRTPRQTRPPRLSRLPQRQPLPPEPPAQ